MLRAPRLRDGARRASVRSVQRRRSDDRGAFRTTLREARSRVTAEGSLGRMGVYTTPANSRRAESESSLRAARTLAALGLIATTRRPAIGRTLFQNANVQHIRLTKIGEAVVDQTWAELADGTRIRWPEALDAVQRRVRLRGIRLVRLFAQNVRAAVRDRRWYVSASEVPARVLDALSIRASRTRSVDRQSQLGSPSSGEPLQREQGMVSRVR